MRRNPRELYFVPRAVRRGQLLRDDGFYFLFQPPDLLQPILPNPSYFLLILSRLEAYLHEEAIRLHTYKRRAPSAPHYSIQDITTPLMWSHVAPTSCTIWSGTDTPVPNGLNVTRSAGSNWSMMVPSNARTWSAPRESSPRCWFYGCMEYLRPNVIQSVPNTSLVVVIG